MTTKLAFTQGSLRRAISAARKEGLRVTGIRADGSLILDDRPGLEVHVALQPDTGHAEGPSKWEDVKA